MSFFAILFALLIEQARPLARSNPIHAGLRAWALSVCRSFDAGQSRHGWVAWGLISIWFLYRIVRGMVAMNKGQSIDV